MHSPSAPFFFFSKVDISLHTLIQLFRPGSVHSGSASWDDCGRVFPQQVACELVPGLVPTLNLYTVISLRLRWAKVFRYNLPPTPLAEWPGPITWHCGNTGVERTPNKSQHTCLTPEKKILPLRSVVYYKTADNSTQHGTIQRNELKCIKKQCSERVTQQNPTSIIFNATEFKLLQCVQILTFNATRHWAKVVSKTTNLKHRWTETPGTLSLC